MWPKSDQAKPKLVEARPELAKVRPKSNKVGQLWAKFERHRTKPDRNTQAGQSGLNPTKLDPDRESVFEAGQQLAEFVEFGLVWAELGPNSAEYTQDEDEFAREGTNK